MYNVIILFGVSGCGKSLIGNQLSKDFTCFSFLISVFIDFNINRHFSYNSNL